MKLKKIMAVVLCIAMVLSTMSFPAFATETTTVAKIGETGYETFDKAIEAANALTGDVTVEIYDAVEFTQSAALKGGAYSSISFVGKDTDAKITINIPETQTWCQYLESNTTVSFTNLILDKANIGYQSNSGHMGNYFTIHNNGVGSTTYTNCTFPNGASTMMGTATYIDCTFSHTKDEYSMWIYNDSTITVDSCTVDGPKGIKLYCEGGANSGNDPQHVVIKNTTFTENLTAKAAVALTYGEKLELIGNTYNNPTPHIELNTTTDSNNNGTVIVAQDAQGNDISGKLTCVANGDPSTAAKNGVLVTETDGTTKIYTSVAEAAKDVTSNSTVTLLHDSTETVELPSSVTLDKNGYTADEVMVAAPVEVATFDELVEALADGGEIKLTADIKTTAAITTSGITATIDLNGKTLTIGAGDNKFNDASNITIKNGNVVITGVTVNGNAIFCLDEYEETLVTTLTLDDVNLTGNGYSSAYGIFYIGDSSVLNVNGGTWNLANDTFAAGGVFKADDAKATLNIDGLELTAHNVRRVVTYANTTIKDSTMNISGDADGVDTEMEHGFNRSPLAITNSTITMKDMVGRGITAECGAVSISSNSTVTITNAQEATIDVRGNQTVTVDSTSTVTVDAEPTITNGTITGVTVNVPPKGNVPYAYTSATTIWGETWSNATESYVIKVLDADGNVMGTTTLNPELYNFAAMNGNVAPTWHISLDPSTDTDTYWIQKWTTVPSIANQPAKVELWVDGVKVNEGSVYLNEADDKNKKCAAVTDANGVILSYVGITDNTYGSDFTAALQAALTAGGNIVMLRDATLNDTLTIPEGVTVNLDLNGKTLTGSILAPNADLTVKNGSIVNNDSNVSAIEINKGTLSLENVNIDSARHAVRIDGEVKATINGGTYRSAIGDSTKTLHAINVSGNADVTINSGTFTGPKGTVADSGSAVNVQAGATVTINGGTFSGGKNDTLASKGTLTVYGGTYDQNPSAYIAKDYVVGNDGTNWIVGEMPDATVKVLDSQTLRAGDYKIYTGSLSESTSDITMPFVMQFIANDTAEEAKANAFGNWNTDFYISLNGTTDVIDLTGCYLVGEYGDWGWIAIPLDEVEIKGNTVYPVLGSVAKDWFTYTEICSEVKDFKCGIYLTDDVLAKYPDLKVSLDLRLAPQTIEAGDTDTNYLSVGEHTYTAEELAVDFVAQIGDTKYASLKNAVEDAQDGDTITLIKEYEITESIEIAKAVTVDLNGNKLTGPDDGKSNWYAFIVDGGDLTLKDSVGTGELWAKCYGVETKSGSFTMESGKITATNNKTLGSAIVNYGGNVSVNGGTISGAFAAVHTAGYFANAATEINGGTIDGIVSIENYENDYTQTVTAVTEEGKELPETTAGYEWKTVGKVSKLFKSATSATVKAYSETSTVKAGDTVTVKVIAEGFDFTNGDWELRYDPTMFELDAAKTTYYVDTAKGVKAQSVNSADKNTLAGEVIAVGGSYKQGNEIPTGTALATYTFTVLPQSEDTVTGKFDIVSAHINTYDYAVSQTNVPAVTQDFDITITREGRVITGNLEVANNLTYNGDFQRGNAFVVDDTVVGKDSAVITYSNEENGTYTTELPAFKEAGSYSIWVKVSVDGYADYKAEHDYMVIGAKEITLSLEVAAGAAYQAVNVKPVITGVYDAEFKGTLTITGVEGEYTKDDFIYMGNGMAIAKEARPMSVVAGKNDVTIAYTQATTDNYASATATTTVEADKAFATQTIVDSLNAAADKAVTFPYNGTEHKAQDKIVAPDGWSVTVTRISDGTANPGVTNVADKEFVEIKFTHDNYNDVDISRVLKVEPLDLTIIVPDFEKGAGEPDNFTTKPVTYESEKFVASDEFATINDLVATANLNVAIVRKTFGEEAGKYDLTATYTPNDNYDIFVKDGAKLTIGEPSDTKIEVVNNKLNGNGNSSADYVAGYKLVLVYTNTATARYTYDNKAMFDLSDAGYEYFDNTKSIEEQTEDNYKYVYGIIVKAETGKDDTYYADKVDFVGTNEYTPEKIVYDADINDDDMFTNNDTSSANSVLNVEYELDSFTMYYFLKADYDRTAEGDSKNDKMVKMFDVQEVQKFIKTKIQIQ